MTTKINKHNKTNTISQSGPTSTVTQCMSDGLYVLLVSFNAFLYNFWHPDSSLPNSQGTPVKSVHYRFDRRSNS